MKAALGAAVSAVLCALPVTGQAQASALDADGGLSVPDEAAAESSLELEPFQPSAKAGGRLEEADAGVLQIIPAPSLPAVPPGGGLPQVRLRASLRLAAGVDTHFDSPRGAPLAEQVASLAGTVQLAADLKLSATLRAVVEARGFYRAGFQAGGDRAKATFEPSVGEAFLDVYSRAVDLRLGSQVVAFGANPAFAPSDVLNPRDFRRGLLSSELEEAKLPVVAARALTELGKVRLTAFYAPFFTPARYDVFGQDTALLQPGLGVEPPVTLDPSIEDWVQPRLLETKRPRDFGWLGDWGVRAEGEVGRVTVAASWAWVNEKLPAFTLDPEAEAFFAARAGGRSDAALAASLAARLEAGESLATGVYPRQHVFSLDAALLVGPAQLDLDVGYSPAQTFFDASLAPVRKSVFTWVVGVSQAEDSSLVYNVTYVGLGIRGVAADEQLLLVEPGTARGAARTAWLHLLLGTVGYSLLDDSLELLLRAAFEPIQRSFAAGPRVLYRPRPGVGVWLGFEVYAGPSISPLGYFGRNDQVLLGLALDL